MEALQETKPAAVGPHIVVIGGGFGGLSVARRLGGAPCRVTLIDRQNFHLFVPLLYQVATAALSPGDIAEPIRQVLARDRNVEVRLDEVTGVDTARRRVVTKTGEIGYDVLVIATGSGQSYFGHPEWATHAPGLKSIADAQEIRNKLLMAFEEAERTDDAARRAALMTIVLVGGGPTGVEMAGAVSELARHTMRRDFRRISPADARIVLVEAMPRLLGPFPEKLASHAQRVLEGRGVELRFNAPVEDVGEDYVVAGGERIPAGTIVWTAGVAASPAGKWLGVETDRAGRVLVDANLAVPGHDGVYVIGDAAHAKGEDGEPLPGLAQVAKQQGEYLGRALAAQAQGRPWPGPFKFRNYGNMATIGRNQAVADFSWWRTAGFVAWLLWSVVHVFLLIGFRNRVLVSVQWLWAYLTYQRGVRLILGDRNRSRLSMQDVQAQGRGLAQPPKPDGAVGNAGLSVAVASDEVQTRSVESTAMKPGESGTGPKDGQKKPSSGKERPDRDRDEDAVDEAVEESFPASDPPSYNPQKTGG